MNQKKLANEIRSELQSDLLSNSEIDEVFNQTLDVVRDEKVDKRIGLRTIAGSLLGGFIGGTIGGVLWGLQMIYSEHVFFIFGLGLIVLNYAFIRLFTRQSKKNIVVLILTILSTLYALWLGGFLYANVGYLGT